MYICCQLLFCKLLLVKPSVLPPCQISLTARTHKLAFSRVSRGLRLGLWY